MTLLARILLPVLAVGLIPGCASTSVNWDAQVGRLSYFQAVKELGNPTKQTQNADGQTVAEWVSRYPINAPGMDNDFKYYSASFGPDSSATIWRQSKLSLTFNTNSLLTGWSKD